MERVSLPFRPRFDVRDWREAWEEWGCNCGPGALAGLLGLTLDEVRVALEGFEAVGHTKETLMRTGLSRLGCLWEEHHVTWPDCGLVRVVWNGPWDQTGDPWESLRHSHWVASRHHEGRVWVFDINAMSVGGWVTLEEWDRDVVPWLLKACEPEATGGWRFRERWKVLGSPRR